MEKKRFKVVTFRGYYDTDVLDDAIEMGKEMIKGIMHDKWENAFHWARVIDENIGISFLMYMRKGDEIQYTPWLALR